MIGPTLAGRILLCGGLAMMVWLLLGCDFIPMASDWKRCTFEISSIQFQGFRDNQTEWKISLTAHNPNSKHLRLEGLSLLALFGADTLATLQSLEPLDLSPGDTTRIPVDVALPHSTWNKVLVDMRSQGKTKIEVVGDAFYHTVFGTKKISGAFRKSIDFDFDAAVNAMGGKLFQGLLLSP